MRKIWIVTLLVVGLAAAVVLALKQTQLLQHASVDTFSNLAVTGTIFVDSNNNGIQDKGETGYSGSPKPIVRLATFSSFCTSPSPRPSGIPTPVICPDGERKVCPEVACARSLSGQEVCPPCSCVTQPTRYPIYLNNDKRVQDSGQEQGWRGNTGKAETHSLAASPTGMAENNPDVTTLDLCGEHPVSVINCPVDATGGYSCIVTGSTFSRATLLLNPPVGYRVTTNNNPYNIPANVLGQSAFSVNFGIIQTPVGRIPSVTPDITPITKCIPQPICLGKRGCQYPTPPSGWCPVQSTPFTVDQTKTMLDYLNQVLRTSHPE